MYSPSQRRGIGVLVGIVTFFWITTLVNSTGVTSKRDCTQIQSCLTSGEFSSGPYEIKCGSGKRPVKVSCDMETDGGGWTVIQRRVDNSVGFNRTWDEYSRGFGQPLGNFWIGLSYLHSILTQERYVLRIDMEDWEGNKRYAQYNDFFIDDQGCKYKLVRIGEYCGDAGDSLAYHVGSKFSTLDQDNDNYGTSCVALYKGAWWYNACHYSDLNGEYKLTGATTTNADGVYWYYFKSTGYYSLKRVEMKIRPYNF